MKRALILIVLLILVSLFAVEANEPTESVISLVNTSILYEQQNNYIESLKRMEAAAQECPDDYAVQLRLGWTRYKNAKYNQSEAAYRKAIELSSQQSVEAFLGLTYPLAALNEWGQVESAYLKILELDPKNYDSNLYLGQLLANRGDTARAKVYLETAHRLYPSSYSVNLSLGWIYVSTGDKSAARECFLRALMFSPADTSANRGLGLVR